MPVRVKRREFVSGATAGAAGVLGFLYPGATAVARGRGSQALGPRVIPQSGVTLQTLAGPDPTFAQGTVTALVSSASLVTTMVLVGASGARNVSMVPTDVVWKEVLGSPTLIESGDTVILKGSPQSDGSLAAQSGRIFVNLERRDGVVMAASSTGITLNKRNQAIEAVALSSSLEVIHQRDGSPYSGGAAAIPPNTPVGAVGIALADGSFRATRVWVVD